ncbi:MAG: prolyl oligopeptidase family serine peptidase, partial [Planctomycetota bacterium]|nr:prolyl oligopeptidase family serine peptidase [Planctomycetota bacterium]
MKYRCVLAQMCVFSWLAACGFATEEKTPCCTDHSRLMVYLDESGKEHPIKTASDWAIRRRHILETMQLVMGPLPKQEQFPPLKYKTTQRLEEKDFVRLTISLLVEENDRVSAFLYLPKGRPEKQRTAGILALHPTSALGKRVVAGENPKPNRSYALELAERGYVVIAPDYPPFGDYKGYDFNADKYLSGTMKGIVNHMRCVDLLQSLDEVDPQRIGVIGHSLGGHNAIFVGAFDKRIKAIVSSCGWTSFAHDDVPSWTGPCYMPLIRDKYRSDPMQIPFDFCEI